MGLRGWLRRIWERFPRVHFHVHREVATTPGDLIDLIDRFIDNQVRYPFEWDDFISWEQDNPNVEAARQAIGKYEGWLFSKNQSKIDAYAYRAAEERNRLAAILGRPLRELPALDSVGEALIRPTVDPQAVFSSRYPGA